MLRVLTRQKSADQLTLNELGSTAIISLLEDYHQKLGKYLKVLICA